jgi:hypothetical protein
LSVGGDREIVLSANGKVGMELSIDRGVDNKHSPDRELDAMTELRADKGVEIRLPASI